MQVHMALHAMHVAMLTCSRDPTNMQAYLAHLQTTGFKYAFMEYTLDDQPFGRMVRSAHRLIDS